MRVLFSFGEFRKPGLCFVFFFASMGRGFGFVQSLTSLLS